MYCNADILEEMTHLDEKLVLSESFLAMCPQEVSLKRGLCACHCTAHLACVPPRPHLVLSAQVAP